MRFNGHIDVGVCSPVLNWRASVREKVSVGLAEGPDPHLGIDTTRNDHARVERVAHQVNGRHGALVRARRLGRALI